MTQCMYKHAVRVLGLNYVASNITITCDVKSKQLESVNKASPTHTHKGSINKVYVLEFSRKFPREE